MLTIAKGQKYINLNTNKIVHCLGILHNEESEKSFDLMVLYQYEGNEKGFRKVVSANYFDKNFDHFKEKEYLSNLGNVAGITEMIYKAREEN